MKRERRDKPRKASSFGKNRNPVAQMLPLLVHHHLIPERRRLVQHPILQEQLSLLIFNRLTFLLVMIFAFQDTTPIRSSQQFLSHHHRRTLITQDRFQNTEIFYRRQTTGWNLLMIKPCNVQFILLLGWLVSVNRVQSFEESQVSHLYVFNILKLHLLCKKNE